MGTLDGKIALITGAGSGMGKASCAVFAREGANVVAADISGAEEATAAELGDAVVPVRADVTSEADVEQMVRAAVERFGRLDILLNVAGIGLLNRLPDVTMDEYDAVMNVDLRGVLLGMKYGIPAMLDSGGGSIVNWSSLAGLNAKATTGVYSAAKAGVIALTKTAAVESGPQGIRANVLCPGFIRTEMMGANMPDSVADHTPLQRIGTSSEVAEIAAFVASDRASYMTGAVLPIDGGLSAELA